MKNIKRSLVSLVVSLLLILSAWTSNAADERYKGAIIVGGAYDGDGTLYERLNGYSLYPKGVEDFSSFSSDYKKTGSTDTGNPSAHIYKFDASDSGTIYEITTDTARPELGRMLFVHDVKGATGNANSVGLYRDDSADINKNEGLIRIAFKIKPLTNTDGVAVAGINLWAKASSAVSGAKDDDFLLADGTILGTDDGEGNRITYSAGQWMDFEMLYDRNTGESGVWNVWMNGTQIITNKAPVNTTTDNKNKLITIRANKYNGTGDVGFYIDDISLTKEYNVPRITGLAYDSTVISSGERVPIGAAAVSVKTDKDYYVLSSADVEVTVNGVKKETVLVEDNDTKKVTVQLPDNLYDADIVTVTVLGTAKVNDRTVSFSGVSYTDVAAKAAEAVEVGSRLSASFTMYDPDYTITAVTPTQNGADITLKVSDTTVQGSPVAVAYVYGPNGEIISLVLKKITTSEVTLSLTGLPADFDFKDYEVRLFILENNYKNISFKTKPITW